MRFVPELALNGPLGLQPCLLSRRGVTKLLDFKSSCVIKNRRKASNIKVLKFIDQNSALGCLSDKSLTKKQHQGNISQHIYRYVSMCVMFSLAARTVQRSSNILLPLFPLGPAKQHVTLSPLQFLLPYQLIPNTQLLCMCVGVFFPLHLGTECSHSVYFFVFYVLVASSNCPSVVFLCTQGYLHITSHYIPQCTKKHISYSS